jgi:hypothetical protein
MLHLGKFVHVRVHDARLDRGNGLPSRFAQKHVELGD